MNVDALRVMGTPKAEWGLDDVGGVDREPWIALLDRAAEIGLLRAVGDGYYTIHPALPWFFKELFDTLWPPPAEAPTRAYVEAMGGLGDYYHGQYADGNLDVVAVLQAEEANDIGGGANEKVGVLEDSQQPEVEDERRRQ